MAIEERKDEKESRVKVEWMQEEKLQSLYEELLENRFISDPIELLD